MPMEIAQTMLAQAMAAAPVEACEETYGVFPCSSSFWGSIFLVCTYGYLLLQGANLISDGSELLLAVMDPGLIGGLLLPILGALPDSAMIVMSGLGGSIEQAKEQIAVGIGTLAGSTIMLLSIAWGGSLWLGRCDLERGMAVDKRLTRQFDLTKTGVTSDAGTRINAYIMVASSLLFLTPQIPSAMGYMHDPAAALWGGILCLVSLAAYCVFQVVWPELQKRQADAAHRKLLRANALQMASSIAKAAGSVLIDSNGEVREDALRELFVRFDSDKSGAIDGDELRKMMTVLSQANRKSPTAQELERDVVFMLQELDADGDGKITLEELKLGVRRWLAELKKQSASGEAKGGATDSTPLLSSGQANVDEEAGGADDDDDDEDESKEPMTPAQIIGKAAQLLVGGTFIVALISDPMVDSVSSFSKASGVPAFFVAFVVTPFASNASELVSSLQFAKKKKIKNISLTFSQVYGAVTMNNTMCLGLFLLIVWYRGLDWDFSSEVTTTMVSIFALGVVASTRNTFETYWAFVSLMLYPLALALVFFLDYQLGWH
mmetsp:Transcript_20031/g.47705  ORF Transcript_20031/g.47705 Transcript_20031/m.47705 type:complete len:548 (+) Transcript_20031:15-1658(+)